MEGPLREFRRSSLSVVIPAHNEEGAVGSVVRRLRSTLDEDGVEYEVIVVDDGSTDRTSEESQKAGAEVIALPANMGYGSALRIGILAARFERVLICDADGTYPCEMAARLLHDSYAFDMVVAQRTGSVFNGPWYRRPLRWTLKQLSRFIVGRPVPDVNSGFRIFKTQLAVRYFGLLSSGFSFTTGLTLAMMLEGFTVHFMPASYEHRVGKTKVKTVRDSLRMLQVLVRAGARYNPLKLFLLPCGFATLFSLAAFGAWIVTEDPIAAVVASIFLVCAILVLSQGLSAEAARTTLSNDPRTRYPD